MKTYIFGPPSHHEVCFHNMNAAPIVATAAGKEKTMQNTTTLESGLSAAQREALAQAVAEQLQLQRRPGDAPPSIVEIRAALAPASSPHGTAIVRFKDEFTAISYTFDNSTGQCWVTTGSRVLRYGNHYGAPPVVMRGLAVDTFAKQLQDILCSQGIEIQYEQAMITASKVLACPPGPSMNASLGTFLTELMSAARKGGKG